MTREEVNIKLNQFKNDMFNHNGVDFDGYYSKQCFDLSNAWLNYLYPNSGRLVGDSAYQIYTDVQPATYDKFTRVTNTPEGVPSPGAIMVWGTGVGPWGHTAVVLSANVNNFTSLDQNWTGNNELAEVYHNYNNVLGWLEPIFTAQTTTQVTNLVPYQRVSVSQGVNRRQLPTTKSPILETFGGGLTFDFGGYVHGESVDGNDIWYKGRYSETYFWSGGFTDSSTNGLNLIETVQTTPPNQPSNVLVADSPLVTRTVYTDNFSDTIINPEFIVVHWWGDPNTNPTIDGVINHFKNTAAQVSAHYIVNDFEVVQMVKENKRAWHAGSSGNNHIGIEFDPNGGDAMYTRGASLIKDIRTRLGKQLPLKKHSDFMPTACPGNINLDGLNGIVQVPPSIPVNPVQVPTSGSQTSEFKLNIVAIITALIAGVNEIVKQLTSLDIELPQYIIGAVVLIAIVYTLARTYLKKN